MKEAAQTCELLWIAWNFACWREVVFVQPMFFSQRFYAAAAGGSLNWIRSKLARVSLATSLSRSNQFLHVLHITFTNARAWVFVSEWETDRQIKGESVDFLLLLLSEMTGCGEENTIDWSSFCLAEEGLCYAIMSRKQWEDTVSRRSWSCRTKYRAWQRIQTTPDTADSGFTRYTVSH